MTVIPAEAGIQIKLVSVWIPAFAGMTTKNAQTMKTLVLGLGNILLQDEGVGVRAVERLQHHPDLPADVEVLDGGTLGLELLSRFEGVERLIVVDAVDAAAPPGALLRFADEEIPASRGPIMSPHQVGLPQLMALARMQGILPASVVLWGMQVQQIRMGLDLSPPVAARVDALVQAVVEEVKRENPSPVRKNRND